MRVVLASLDYPPDVTEGVARQRELLARSLARLGHDVHVVTRGRSRAASCEDGVSVHRFAVGDMAHEFLAALPVLDRPLTDAQWLAEAVCDVVSRVRADIVDVPLWLAQPVGLVRRPACPVAVWLQTSLLQMVELQGREPRAHERVLADVDRFVMTHAAGRIADSASVADAVGRLYSLPPSLPRAIVVHPGIDAAPLASPREPAQTIEGLIVGRLEQRKGTQLLLEILPALLTRVPRLTLRFVGRDNSASDGFLRETGRTYPEAFAARHPELMDRVRFEGYLGDEELNERYRTADLLIHPALYESFGLIFLEAMRASLPVVAFAAGGALEVFGDHDGDSRGEGRSRSHAGARLVPPGDADGLVAAIAALASDPLERARVGGEGRRRFESRFTSDRMARDTVAAYQQLLETSRPCRAAAGRVFHVMEALQERDAVSRIARTNAVLAGESAAETRILSLFAESSVRHETGRIRSARFAPADGAIFHYWGFSRLEGIMRRFGGRKAIHYHNITPPHFFAPRTPHYEMTRRGYAQLERIAGAFDLIIGDSNYNLAEYARHLDVPRPALCVYPLVDAAALQAARWDTAYGAALEREVDGPLWLFVGRFAPNKRQDQLMRAFDRFVATGRRGQLAMVGDVTAVPAYVADLERLRARLPAGDRMLIVPMVGDEQLRAFYRVARLFVCASEHEGFCLPLAEAMAFGVPTIALDRGAVGETVGDAGVLVPSWNPEDVAAAAATLLDSPVRRAELAANQRRRLRSFSTDAIAHRLRAAVRYLRHGERSPLFRELSPRRSAGGASISPAVTSEERHAWSISTN